MPGSPQSDGPYDYILGCSHYIIIMYMQQPEEFFTCVSVLWWLSCALAGATGNRSCGRVKEKNVRTRKRGDNYSNISVFMCVCVFLLQLKTIQAEKGYEDMTVSVSHVYCIASNFHRFVGLSSSSTGNLSIRIVCLFIYYLHSLPIIVNPLK